MRDPVFEVLGPDAYRARLAAYYGVDLLTSREAVAEVARAELFALGQTLRWVLARRVMKLLGAFEVTAEVAEEALRSLEIAGDLSAGPGGEVARAPLRAVSVGAQRWLFAGTLPTADLKERVGGLPTGTPRRLVTLDADRVRRAVADLGGRELDVEQWAGLSRTPPFREWLEELDGRLEAATRFADRTGALRWDDEEAYAASGGRWVSGAPGAWSVLTRARQAGGWKAYAWGRAVGGKVARVPLTWDEARRTMIAVTAAAGSVTVLGVVREGGRASIALPLALPAAEYRWLSAVGEMKSDPRRVEVAEDELGKVGALLWERLGVRVEGTG
jgi:hypothetical protein